MSTPVYKEAESNLITKDQMTRVREVDFVERFAHNGLKKLMEVLGITRKIPMTEGTTMYLYKTVGTLQDGSVPEGEIIPLSQYERTKTPIGELTLGKWRKATSAEAIMKSGYNEAVNETDKKLVGDCQTSIRTKFFNVLNGISGTVVGASTLQAVLAQSWGKLQVLYENDTIEPVHFINPLTIADYLETATVTLQTAFGMSYIENFLGLGTVFMNTGIPKDKVVSTAKDNLILYFLPMSGDVAKAFNLTTDETGFIGINSGNASLDRAQVESLVMSGVQFFPEWADGVVFGQIDSTPTLQSITVTSTDSGATASGDSVISMSGYSLGTGEKFVYKCGASAAPSVNYGQKLGSGWTDIDSGDNITPGATMTKIAVAAVDAQGRAQAYGSADLTKKT